MRSFPFLTACVALVLATSASVTLVQYTDTRCKVSLVRRDVGKAVSLRAHRAEGQFLDGDPEDSSSQEVAGKPLLWRIASAPSIPSMFEEIATIPVAPGLRAAEVAAALQKLALRRQDITEEISSSPLIFSLVSQAQKSVEDGCMTAQQAATIAWSVATLREEVPQMRVLLPSLVQVIGDGIGGFPTKISCDALRAVLLLYVDCPELLRLLAPLMNRITNPAHSVASDQLVTCWAVIAHLQHKETYLQDFVPWLITQTQHQAEGMTPQLLARVMRCVATLREDMPQVLELKPLLLRLSYQNVRYMSPHDAAQVVWALGVIEERSEQVDLLLRAICGQMVKKLRERALEPADLAAVLWGMADLGEKDAELMEVAASELVPRVPSMSNEAASKLPRIICAFARLGVPCGSLLRAAAARLWALLPRLDNWSLWALSWSYEALAECGDFSGFRNCLHAETLRRSFDEASPEA